MNLNGHRLEDVTDAELQTALLALHGELDSDALTQLRAIEQELEYRAKTPFRQRLIDRGIWFVEGPR